MDKIKILLADDHDVVRVGTRQILAQEPDMEVVAEAVNGREAIEYAGANHPDVAIIDINMPEIDGIEATKQIKRLHPHVAVLVLTAYDDEQFVFSLLEAGAAGYLLKNTRGIELIDAVRHVHAGESSLHPAIARKVLNRFVRNRKDRSTDEARKIMSPRELEVLKLATKGLSNQDIADILSLSLRTVQAHLGHIFNKLQVSSRTEAVVRALKAGWITLDELD